MWIVSSSLDNNLEINAPGATKGKQSFGWQDIWASCREQTMDLVMVKTI